MRKIEAKRPEKPAGFMMRYALALLWLQNQGVMLFCRIPEPSRALRVYNKLVVF
jgi:hypothetical protein